MKRKYTSLHYSRKRFALAKRRQLKSIKLLSRHPFSLPIAVFLLLVLGTLGILTFIGGGTPKLKQTDSTIVILSHDRKEQIIPTRAKTVGELLQKLDITLRKGDVVEPSLATEIVSDNFRVNVYRAVPVTIVDGDHKTFAYSAAATARSIVKQAGIRVYPEDSLSLLPTTNFLLESSIGERVVITRSAPVTLNLYGKFVPTRTLAKTVGDVLKEKNITLMEGDTLQPAPATRLTSATKIFVTRKGVKIEIKEEKIAMPVRTVNDNALSFGVTAVRQQGSPGKRLVTYQTDTKTGKRTRLQDVVIQDPVPEVVARGTYVNIASDKGSVMAAAGINSGDYAYVDYIISRESHWNPGALNAGGCAGLGQACPGSKLAAVCPSWQTDPVCQMKFFHGYAIGRYGTWQAAYNFKAAKGWW